MPVTAEEIKELTEKVKTGLGQLHSKIDEKEDKGEKHFSETKEQLDKHSQDIAKLVDEVEKKDKEFEDLKKQNDDLILSLARKGGQKNGDGKIIVPEEVKSTFDLYMSNTADRNVKSMVPEEIHEKNIRQLVSGYMPNASDSKIELAVKSMLTEGAHNAAGMFCPMDMDTNMIRRVFETTPILDMATVMNVTAGSMMITLDDEEPEIEAPGETGTRNETKEAGYGDIIIDTHELTAEPSISRRMLQDSSIDIEGEVTRKGARKFARELNTWFVNGDGVRQAKGFMNTSVYPDASDVDTYERGKIGTYETAAAGSLTADDLILFPSYLLEEYQGNAEWLGNRLTFAKIAQLKDQEGQYLLRPDILFNGTTPQLLGYRFRMGSDIAKPSGAGNTFQSGQYPLAFGDFSEGYRVLRRIGINILPDPYTDKRKVKYFLETRMGGAVVNFQAIKRLKIQ